MNQQGMDWAPEEHGGGDDFFPTPPAVTRALLDTFPPPKGPIVEPCAGGGAICSVLMDYGYGEIHAVEIRPEEEKTLNRLLGLGAARYLNQRCRHSTVTIGDWMDVRDQPRWGDMVSSITNPPFNKLPDIAHAAGGCGPYEFKPLYVAILMPIEEICGVSRARRYPVPTGMVSLTWRPFHCCRGVAWFVWERGKPPMNLHVVGC